MNTTIRTRLFTSFLLVLIIPSIAIGWFSYNKAVDEVKNQIIANAEQAVVITDNEITDLVSSALSDMDYLATRIDASIIEGFDSPKLRAVLDQYKSLHPQFLMAFVGTPDGIMIRSPEQVVEGYDPRTRDWYKNAMADKGTAVLNDPSVSASSGKVVVVPSKTTTDGSGVIGGNLDISVIAESVNRIKIGKLGYITVIDSDQKYLIHPTKTAGTEDKDGVISQFFVSNAGQAEYEFNGLDKMAVFATNELTGWKIVGGIELSEVASATRGIMITTIAVIAIALLLGIMVVIVIIRSITKPLQYLISATSVVADGDLTEAVDIHSKDEIGQLAASVNHMIVKLRGLIGGVLSASQNVAAASEQISATTEEVASGSSLQADASQTMYEQFSELSKAINSVAESAEQASKLAANTTLVAQSGGETVRNSVDSMNQVSSQMERLEEDSVMIGEIIEVINDISEQTNLLALNAAIEAARAGDQGRGFAVVADEVRKLAERSGEASKQISVIIKGMQENTRRSVLAVSSGVEQSKKTGHAFEEIVSMINETESKVGEIAAASEEQAAQASEVMHSIESISSASEEAAAAAEETASTSQSLAELASGLNDSVSIFKV